MNTVFVVMCYNYPYRIFDNLTSAIRCCKEYPTTAYNGEVTASLKIDEYEMNGGYHSDLSKFILDNPQILLWTHGHTHEVLDYKLGETRIVCNPRGYEGDTYSENTGWDPNLILEI